MDMGQMATSFSPADLSVRYSSVAAGKMTKGGDNASEQKVAKAAKDFEAMFLSQMLQPMFETNSVDDMFGGGHGEQMMRSLLVTEYGKSLANSNTLGLSDSIKNEMIHLQESRQQALAASSGSAAEQSITIPVALAAYTKTGETK